MALSKKVRNTIQKSKSSDNEEVKRGNRLNSTKEIDHPETNVRLLEAIIKILDTSTDNGLTLKGFLEEIKDQGDATWEVLVNLYAAFKHLSFALSEVKEQQEDELLETVYESLRFFLFSISGFNIPIRRPLLNEIAIWVNQPFTKYKFISPEQTLLVDPKIHMGDGVDSQEIAEGLSFAVLHRSTLKTVRYASIKVK
ncbi:hypothetical protein QQ020_21705 [Fulvivirgaceae bacterium BMA12]|uniref:Uncharacterized protein n=1 Tax=Agaribacillus aureus TaxID=3051825 RepID=A0ABT8LAC3_9BACT|nr:hypothetical protein [Fulvivirgaceae bacterium BMA12]